MILTFLVRNQTISYIDTKVTPRIGSSNYLQLKFNFVTKDWNSLRKTLHISAGEYSEPFILESNIFDVPTYYTQQESFKITLLGDNESEGTVVPTNVLVVSLDESNSLWTAEPPDPQNSAYIELLNSIGNLNDLNTEAKDNLVAAVNEVKHTADSKQDKLIAGDNITIAADGKTISAAGGGSTVELDTTLTQSGKAADAAAVGNRLNALSEEIGGGLSETAKTLLVTILRNGVYGTDQSANITALDTALGGGTTEPEEPDVPVETTYAISNELINCTSSNSATSAKENAAYSTTLTANDGYTLTGGTVTITMGGVDITSTAYADGVISIAAVTGDVEIFASAVVVQAEAALPEDGLVGYFDFRTTTYDNAVSVGKTTIAPTKGSGQLYAWANNSISAQNEYGLKPANTRSWQYDQNGGTNETALGDAFTVIQLTYGEAPKFGFDYSNMPPKWMFCPKYINASGSTVDAEKIIGSKFNSDSKEDYNFTVFRADGATLTEIFDTSRTTYNGGDIDGFSRWLDTPYGNVVVVGDNIYCTAMAIYNRALTDSEIEAAREFMKTLEVTA